MTRPHLYVECDVPEGMTLAAYRAAKAVPAPPRRGLVGRLVGARRPARSRPDALPPRR